MRIRRRVIFGLAVMLASAVPGWAQFSGVGEGTPEAPYIIETAAQLDEARNDLTAHYRLDADIDLDVAPYNTGQGWVPIGGSGTPIPPFSGTFDGNGHTVTGMRVNRIAGYVGLFGYIDAAGVVMNVGMVNVSINSTGSGSTSFNNYIGGLAGANAGTIDNCYVTGTITAPTKNNVGGLAGNNLGGTIKNSYSAADVTGADHVGGVSGQQNGGKMENCYAIGAVTGNSGVGGLVGWNVAPASQNSVENSAALNSSVSGSVNVGRVSGNSVAAFADNAAFEGMGVVVAGDPKTIVSDAGGTDGVSRDACEVVVLGGYFSDWDEFPAHIKAALPDAQSQCGVVTITTDGFPGGDYLEYMELTLAADIIPANASEPMLWEIAAGGSLPSGLTLDPVTGVISGVPAAAGTYTFTVKVTAVRYETSDTKELTIEIAKAATVVVVPEGLTATYGQTLGAVGLPSGWAWNEPEALVGNAGMREHLAMFTPEDADNYSIVADVPLDVMVNKANPPCTAPTNLSAAYGQTLANINMAAHAGWSWMSGSDLVGAAGTRTHLARFTPADTDNYNIIENIPVQITVKKANPPSASYVIPTGLTARVGDHLSEVDLSAFPGWSWMNGGTLVGAAGSRTHLARYTPANSNYSVVENISVRIQVRAIIHVSGIIDLANPPGEDVAGDHWTFYNGVYTVEDGAHVAVVGSNEKSKYRIEVAAGAKNVTIELDSVTVVGIADHPPLLLNPGAEAELTLVGTNVVGAEAGHAGIDAPAGTTLKIGGAGSLTATGGSGGAGIGGGGDIIISGGTITAAGGGSAPGIGGTLTMDGPAIIFASSVDDTDESKRTDGILVTKNDGKTYWYGSGAFTLSYDVIVPDGYTFTIEEGNTLTVPAGKMLVIPDNTTLRIDEYTGMVRDCGGTIIIEGDLPEGLLIIPFSCFSNIVTEITAVYGQTLADINPMPTDNRGTFAWRGDMATSVGTVSEPVKGLYLEFTPYNPAHYYSGSVQVTVTVLKAPQNAPGIALWAAGTAGGWSTSIPGLAAAILTTEATLLLDGYESFDGHIHSPLEYCIRSQGDSVEECVENDVGDWQSSPSFDGLDANMEYTIFVRYEETENFWPSAAALITFRTLLLDASNEVAESKASEPEAVPLMQRGVPNHGDEGYGISLEQRIVRGKADFSVIFPDHLRWANVVIFDNLGNVVFTRQGIKNGERISWNLVNRSGRGVAGGTYLIVATARDRERAYRYSTLLTVGGR